MSKHRRQLRKSRNRWQKPRLSVLLILRWADEFHRRKGRWPHHFDGRISRASEDTWARVNSALAGGDRGLPGGSSLAKLLYIRRGVRSPRNVPALSEAQIVKWARAHFERFGRWPTEANGPVLDAQGETWAAVDLALRRGKRGLSGSSSLAQLLDARGMRPNPQSRPKFTEKQILTLADAFFRANGHWPYSDSGPIADLPGENWESIDRALQRGLRGLATGRTLVSFLDEHRSILGGLKRRPKRIRQEDRLALSQIVAWGRSHKKQTGRYPNRQSGPVTGATGSTWAAIDSALKRGHRGLPGGSSLAKLFGNRRRQRASRS